MGEHVQLLGCPTVERAASGGCEQHGVRLEQGVAAGGRRGVGRLRLASRHDDTRSVLSGASKQRSLFTTPSSINTASNAGYISHERTFINEWRLPQLPTVPSSLSEERQLARLEKQVALIEADLTTHNDLRTPMLHLYSPKGANYGKALANWERKSNWLLQELVKYQSYVEALKRSLEGKAERRAKREVEEMVREGDAMLAELKV